MDPEDHRGTVGVVRGTRTGQSNEEDGVTRDSKLVMVRTVSKGPEDHANS